MFVLATTAVSTPRHVLLRSRTTTIAATTTTCCCCSMMIRGLAAQAGTVKFYLRDKGYGFIQPDQNPDLDVFVHRNSIACTHVIPQEVLDSSLRYPYLKKDERVLFELDYENATGLRKAFNVTWLNGNKIPPERTGFLGGVHERAKGALGYALYDVLQDHLEPNNHSSSRVGNNDATLWKKIRDEFRQAQISIQTGEEIVRRLGMSVKEFPTVKTLSGQGKYVFEKEDTPPHLLHKQRYHGDAITTEELLEDLEIPSSKLRDYSKEEFDDIPDFDALPDDDPRKLRQEEENHEYIIESDDEEEKQKSSMLDDTVWKL
jgi:'Cold-shock' DNA-binding domain